MYAMIYVLTLKRIIRYVSAVKFISFQTVTKFKHISMEFKNVWNPMLYKNSLDYNFIFIVFISYLSLVNNEFICWQCINTNFVCKLVVLYKHNILSLMCIFSAFKWDRRKLFWTFFFVFTGNLPLLYLFKIF